MALGRLMISLMRALGVMFMEAARKVESLQGHLGAPLMLWAHWQRTAEPGSICAERDKTG